MIILPLKEAFLVTFEERIVIKACIKNLSYPKLFRMNDVSFFHVIK